VVRHRDQTATRAERVDAGIVAEGALSARS
jgi:hypothetical protein